MNIISKRSSIPRLTQQESEVLNLMVQGLTNKQIGQKLLIGTGTVKSYVRELFNKLNVNNRTEAAVKAVRSGLLPDLEPDGSDSE
jgi:DNA-binding NarL/FixJ family response regulator